MLTRSLLCATAAFALSACTYSVSGHGDNRSVESAGLVASRDVDVPGDAEFSGMFVGADGDVGGDLDLAGASVRSSAHVGGNLTAAGGRVRFTGEVAGDAEIDAGTGYVDAIIRGDAVHHAGWPHRWRSGNGWWPHDPAGRYRRTGPDPRSGP